MRSLGARGILPMVGLASTVLGSAVVISCGPMTDSRSREADLLPPQLQSVRAEGPSEIAVTFDEAAVRSEVRTASARRSRWRLHPRPDPGKL